MKTLALACLAFVLAAVPLIAADAPNLVANGNFKDVRDGRPDKWQSTGDANVVQSLELAADPDGTAFVKLICTRCDPKSPSSHAMLAQVGVVQLARGRMYEFSCRMRAEGLRGRAVSIAVSDTKTWSNCGLQASLSVGAAWQTYRRIFTATRDVADASRLQFWFNEPGTLCVADVRIAECSAQEAEFTDTIPDAGGRNLVPNGSFETSGAGWLSLGSRVGWGGLSDLHGRIETAGARHGGAFLRIPLGGDDTPVLGFDYFEPVVRRELRPLAASRGWIPVTKGEEYTVSCDLRGSRDGLRAVLGARAKDPGGRSRDYTRQVTLTTEWKRHSLTFRPEFRYAFVYAGPDLQAEERAAVDVDAVQLERGASAGAFEPRCPVEFGIEPSEAGGIFTAGAGAALRLRLANHGAAAARVAVSLAATDFDDKPVAMPPVTADVPAGAAVVREAVIPADWRGFYKVRAEAAGHGQSALVRVAVVPPRSAGDSVLGINHAFTTPHLIRLASKAGVTWYRDWTLRWQTCEPAKGEWRWEAGDAQIGRVLAEGAKVLPLLPPFPSADWASEAPPDLPTTGYPGVRLRQAFGPRDPKEMAEFIGRAVARYKDRIHIWEFLNEPIYTDYALPGGLRGRGGKSYGPADYVALLGVAADAMRKADPACKVIGGIGGGAQQLTREIIEAGALKSLDILNLHMYPGARRPEGLAADMDSLLALMGKSGGPRPIWITEFSYYGADDLPRKPFIPSPNSWAEERLLESERQCADFTVRYFAVMLARGVQKIFIHSGGSSQVNEPNYECALFDIGGAPRKLFPALAVLTELLGPSPQSRGERRVGDSVWAVAFEAGGRSVVIVWSDDAPCRVAAPAEPAARWLDMMGLGLPPGPVTAGSSPVYLVGSAGQAEALLRGLQLTRL